MKYVTEIAILFPVALYALLSQSCHIWSWCKIQCCDSLWKWTRIVLVNVTLDLYSLGGKMSHRHVSWIREAARLDVMIVALWHLTGVSEELPPKCLL